MKHSFWILGLLMLVTSVSAKSGTLTAALASWDMPVPSPSQTVQVLMRVFASEGGWASTADENLIFRVFRSLAGSRRDKPKRIMRVIVGYSNRTFPEGSPFLPPGFGARTKRQQWVSEINIDCTAPPSWTADVQWDDHRGAYSSYQELCVALRKRTWRLYQGKTEDWCVDRVDHWGGLMDMENPRNGGWIRVNCDEPVKREVCAAARELAPKHHHTWPIGCARNLAWCDPHRGVCHESVSG